MLRNKAYISLVVLSVLITNTLRKSVRQKINVHNRYAPSKNRNMKSKNSSFSKWTMIVGIIFTLILLLQPVLDIPRELKASNGSFFNYFTNLFFNSYLDPNAGVLIYLVGYAIVWWKKLWGSIIILAVSIAGFVFSEYDDVRLMYVLIFLVGFLYIMNWNEERKRRDDA